ncbi:MAG: aldehyde ferredoxin oxidoreductase C-terminal domain-containing protein, partial [Firmicutes bacterium]|nr:aldehyde ferredoxin oxidoreductase C-terminal domain-containing protein [Bacillota bacterium]
PRDIAGLLSCDLGREYTEADLMRIGERIVTLERVINQREGMEAKEDRLPRRFLSEGLPEGPAAGVVVDLESMLRDYYRLRGWTNGGFPDASALQALGID